MFLVIYISVFFFIKTHICPILLIIAKRTYLNFANTNFYNGKNTGITTGCSDQIRR
jgi:hypothetical protein